MKHLKNIFITLILLSPVFTWADAWDNLTLQQANQVIEFLKTNPYILDYCDCCDYQGEYAVKTHLMKVTSTEIITCEWNPEFYSVVAKVNVLAEIPNTEAGLDMSSPNRYKTKDEIVITMNYTWAFNLEKKQAAPLYTIISYPTYGETNPNSGYCKKFTTFPQPKPIKNRKYKKWYKRTFEI